MPAETFFVDDTAFVKYADKKVLKVGWKLINNLHRIAFSKIYEQHTSKSSQRDKRQDLKSNRI